MINIKFKITIITISLFFLFVNFNIYANQIEIISDVPGTGKVIENHSIVTVDYHGFLEDGTEFDSSIKRNKPFKFQIGVRKVIQGWEYGILGMREGGKRIIKIPPEFAYGKKGAGNLIPPNSTLIFEVEVLLVEPPNYKIIKFDELLILQENNKKHILFDIRNKKEWIATGVIENSIKVTAFDSNGNFNQNFLNEFNKYFESSSKTILISKMGDTSKILANGLAQELGYKNIYTLEGGINKWISKNLPLIK